jgi:hypothetical protein
MRRGNLFPTRVPIPESGIRYKRTTLSGCSSPSAHLTWPVFPETGRYFLALRGGTLLFGARCRRLGQAKNNPRPTKAANTRSMGRRVLSDHSPRSVWW